MTDILDEVAENPPNQFLQDFAALPVRAKELNLAPFIFELLDILLLAKAGSDIVIPRRPHPELGDVGEDALYSYLRKVLLGSLRKSRRLDLRDHAERLLPDHLFPITKGRVAWDRDEVESLRSKLDAASTAAGLDRFRDIPAAYFRAVTEKVLYIARETRQEQSARRPLPPPPAPRTGKTAWDEYLEREVDREMGAWMRRRRQAPR
jgi:hypothetical protein